MRLRAAVTLKQLVRDFWPYRGEAEYVYIGPFVGSSQLQ